MATGFVLDALNQAICQRAPGEADKLIHHSDRGSQYLSIRYTERLAEAGIDTGPPPLKWSAVMFRKRRIENGKQTTEAGRDCLEVAAG